MASYLPIMFDVSNKNVMVIGGGIIAHEKLTRIADMGCKIQVVALDYHIDMLELMAQKMIPYEKREFMLSDLDGIDIVIAAVNDEELQKKVFIESSKRNILCNAVDLADFCHFIFPSVIRRDDLIVAISTSGASPAFAKHLKKYFEKIIPVGVGEFLRKMRAKRAEMPKGKERMKMLDEMAKEYIESI